MDKKCLVELCNWYYCCSCIDANDVHYVHRIATEVI